MAKSPKVAVITPVFNLIKAGRIDFVKQCIESVHNQTYKNIEHIIQDGASTDGTLEFLQEYADKGWIKLYSEKDINVHDADNKAISKTDAEYINVLGGDDYYKDNDIIEYIVNNYFQDEIIDYVYGDEEQISEDDGTYVKTWKGDAYINEFWRGVSFATGTMFFSKKIFEKEGMFNIKYPICADFDLLMKFKFSDYKSAYCNRVVNVFRYGGGLSSSSITKMNHSYEYSEICYNLWKKFDETITIEKAEYMIKYDEYPEEFLLKLRRYIISLKLKNFDYVEFNKYIENLISAYYYKKTNFYLTYQADIRGIKNLFEILKNALDTQNNHIADCKDDLKNAINFQNKHIADCKDDLKNAILEKNNQNFGKGNSFKIYLFNKIPLIKIIEENNCKKYYVFGIIPILKISKN